jgi:uncharacterized damage-inducible protein DinB
MPTCEDIALLAQYNATMNGRLYDAAAKLTDGLIGELAEELRPPDLEQVLEYRNSRGLRFQKRFGSLLLHFFSHQTHHRGQASTLLTQAGVDIGVTDLLVLIPDVDSLS